MYVGYIIFRLLFKPCVFIDKQQEGNICDCRLAEKRTVLFVVCRHFIQVTGLVWDISGNWNFFQLPVSFSLSLRWSYCGLPLCSQGGVYAIHLPCHLLYSYFHAIYRRHLINKRILSPGLNDMTVIYIFNTGACNYQPLCLMRTFVMAASCLGLVPGNGRKSCWSVLEHNMFRFYLEIHCKSLRISVSAEWLKSSKEKLTKWSQI